MLMRPHQMGSWSASGWTLNFRKPGDSQNSEKWGWDGVFSLVANVFNNHADRNSGKSLAGDSLIPGRGHGSSQQGSSVSLAPLLTGSLLLLHTWLVFILSPYWILLSNTSSASFSKITYIIEFIQSKCKCRTTKNYAEVILEHPDHFKKKFIGWPFHCSSWQPLTYSVSL